MERILEESRDSVTCAICADTFDDPRTLLCSHTFCLHCLIEFRGAGDAGKYKFCPICRKDAVPPITQIQALPKNEFAEQVVTLINERDRPIEPSAPPEASEENSIDGDFYMGRLIEEPTDNGGTVGTGIGVSMMAGLAITVLTGGLGGVLAGLAVAGVGAARSVEAEKKRKRSYRCDGCNKIDSSSFSFKCGMCEDFTLCPKCFKEANHISQLHNAQHLFLKLKRRQARVLPSGPILKAQANDIAKSLNYESTVHGRAYIHTPTRIMAMSAIECKHCGSRPIRGTRYKCGMCCDYDLCSECEYDSLNIHDQNHVFVALRNQADINITSEPLLRAHLYK